MLFHFTALCKLSKSRCVSSDPALLKSRGPILPWQSSHFPSYTSCEGKGASGVMEEVTIPGVWKAGGSGAELEGRVTEEPRGGGTARGSCGRLRCRRLARQEHLVRICWGVNGNPPGFYPLLGCTKSCGPTSVTAVRVRGCGSERV